MGSKIRLTLVVMLGLAWLLAIGPSLAFAEVQKAIITPKGALTCVF
ncbi:MAG: hypothetical protein HYZ81_06345 [Nitrospinae bacterium]|nr:hypothetical protein [Nitrospinota bacterium]